MRPLAARRLDFPVFSAAACAGGLAVAGGGGGPQFGVANRLAVLAAESGEERHAEDTRANLFEKVLADRGGKWLLAVAEGAACLFEARPAGALRLSDSVALRDEEDAVAEFDGESLFLAQGERLALYARSRSALQLRWEMGLGERVVALQRLADASRLLVVLAQRVLLFAPESRQFVQAPLPGESGFAKALTARDAETGRVALLRNSAVECTLFVLAEVERGKAELLLRQRLLTGSGSSLALRGEWLFVGDAGGGVRVYRLRGELSLLATLKAHDLAVTAVLALPALPRGGEQAFVLWSFSLDYHAKSALVCPTALVRRKRLAGLARLLALAALLCALLLAVDWRRWPRRPAAQL